MYLCVCSQYCSIEFNYERKSLELEEAERRASELDPKFDFLCSFVQKLSVSCGEEPVEVR